VFRVSSKIRVPSHQPHSTWVALFPTDAKVWVILQSFCILPQEVQVPWIVRVLLVWARPFLSSGTDRSPRSAGVPRNTVASQLSFANRFQKAPPCSGTRAAPPLSSEADYATFSPHQPILKSGELFPGSCQDILFSFPPPERDAMILQDFLCLAYNPLSRRGPGRFSA